LKEIAYAYDQIHADGIGFMTSFGDTWLGNAAYKPVFEELNRRNAVVFVHPTAADCCRNLNSALAPGSMEYGTDTTRAITECRVSADTPRASPIFAGSGRTAAAPCRSSLGAFRVARPATRSRCPMA